MTVPNSLILLYTRKCKLLCPVCKHLSDPNENIVLSEKYSKIIILQAKRVPSIKKIIFTGGESFSHIEILKKSIRFAKAHRFITNFLVNSYLIRDIENTLLKLETLSLNGLKEISLSMHDFCDIDDATYFNEEAMLLVLSKAMELNLKVEFFVSLTSETMFNNLYLRSFLEKNNLLTNIEITEVVDKSCDGIGSKKLISNDAFYLCNKLGESLAVLPDGRVSFCVGRALFTDRQDIFILGNLSQIPLFVLVGRVKKMLRSLNELKNEHENIQHAKNSGCECCLFSGQRYHQFFGTFEIIKNKWEKMQELKLERKQKKARSLSD